MHCLAVVVALLCFTDVVHAYCLKTAMRGMAARRCVPAQPGDGGVPLTWPGGRSSYRPGADGPIDLETRTELFAHALELWSTADCGGGRRPGVTATPGARARGAITFQAERDDASPGTMATTTLTFDRRTGAVSGARVTFFWFELSPYGVGPELRAVVLHEAGHFLGIAHSNDPLAVMAEQVDEASLQRGVLTRDDVAAVCAAYPPTQPLLASDTPAAASVRAGTLCALAIGWALAALGVRRWRPSS